MCLYQRAELDRLPAAASLKPRLPYLAAAFLLPHEAGGAAGSLAHGAEGSVLCFVLGSFAFGEGQRSQIKGGIAVCVSSVRTHTLSHSIPKTQDYFLNMKSL